MKNKTLIFAGMLSLAALFSNGCATTAGGIAIASGEEATGDVYANAKLANVNPTPAGTAQQQQAVADLNRVGTDLNLFVAGKLSFGELGAVEAQLKADGVALSSNTAALNQINSILNIFAQNLGTGANGLVLPQQALAQQTVANIVLGFGIAVQNYEGQWSVSNPTVWPSPKAST